MTLERAQEIITQTALSYDKIAAHFSQTRQNLWTEFQEFLPYLKDNFKVLDFGCGNGRFGKIIQEKNIHYYGVDISANLLAIAQKNVPQGNFTLLAPDLKLPFPNNYFDLIVCLAAFHHIPSKILRQQILQEFYQLLQPHGILIISVWDFYHGSNKKYLLKSYFFWLKSFLFHKGQDWDRGDVLVPWKNAAGLIQTQRYFHIFSLKELKSLILQNNFLIKVAKRVPHGRYYNNLIIIAQK
ncbi:MAG: class I SAM-dependent methyltransferase [Parcubacteria group bacterium]|nr:class I SAM-dependent methyltransferase [Parcubacteria group bacterium]